MLQWTAMGMLSHAVHACLGRSLHSKNRILLRHRTRKGSDLGATSTQVQIEYQA